MDFGNQVKTIVHYLLIGMMVCLNLRDEFLIVSVLLYIVKHWIELIASHEVRESVVMIDQTIILHGLPIFRGYWACVKVNERFWLMDDKVVIHPYGLGHY